MANKIVGIFGGAFDPVHKGHIKIAEQCVVKLGMDKVIIVPTGISPFNKILTDDKVRLSIIKIAFTDKWYEISDYELRQSKKDKKPSFTINTIKYLARESSTSYVLILGSDSLLTIDQWHKWQDILGYCHLLIISREDKDFNFNILKPSIRDFVIKNKVNEFNNLLNKSYGGIFFTKFPFLPYSSSEIRSRISQKKSIKSFVSPEIFEFISKTGCYDSDGQRI